MFKSSTLLKGIAFTCGGTVPRDWYLPPPSPNSWLLFTLLFLQLVFTLYCLQNWLLLSSISRSSQLLENIKPDFGFPSCFSIFFIFPHSSLELDSPSYHYRNLLIVSLFESNQVHLECTQVILPQLCHWYQRFSDGYPGSTGTVLLFWVWHTVLFLWQWHSYRSH